MNLLTNPSHPDDQRKIFELIVGGTADDWKKFFEQNRMFNKTLRDVKDLADYICVRSAMFSEYIQQRGGLTGRDCGHEKALKKVEKMRKRVRKVLRYACP